MSDSDPELIMSNDKKSSYSSTEDKRSSYECSNQDGRGGSGSSDLDTFAAHQQQQSGQQKIIKELMKGNMEMSENK